VVVTGYGTRQKKDVTGAVSQVKVTQLENENPPSVQDALRGNVPGVVVTSSPNAKGGGNLQIRGRASLSAGTSPLIVLDGVIYQGDLSDINPNDRCFKRCQFCCSLWGKISKWGSTGYYKKRYKLQAYHYI
jgi:outer membrane receptor for ferrienterochelin and colicin